MRLCSPKTIIYETFQLFLNLCQDDRTAKRRRKSLKKKKIMNKHGLRHWIEGVKTTIYNEKREKMQKRERHKQAMTT